MNTIKNICLFLVLSFSIVLSQDLQIQWSKTYDYKYKLGNNIDYAHDGGFIFTKGNNGIVKIDNQGIIQEDWPLDTVPDNQSINYLQKCNEGYITIGTNYQVDGGKRKVVLNKLDNQGRIEWEKLYYNENYLNEEGQEVKVHDFGDLIKQTRDNGYILACTSMDRYEEQSVFTANFWLIKIDQNGEIEWETRFGGDFNEYYSFSTVYQTPDDGFLFSFNDKKEGLLRLTPDGQEIWRKKYDEAINQTLPADDGGFSVSGGNYLQKVDENGDEIWKKTIQHESVNSALRDMVILDDNSYLLCGGILESYPYFTKGWLIKTDSLGNKIWEKTFPEIDIIKQVLQISNNEFILFGEKDEYITIIKIKETDPNDPTKLELLEPVNYKMGIGNQLVLDWTSIANASSYFIEIDENIEMSNPLISKTISNNSNCIIKDLSYSTQYYWRVRAQFPDGSGNWSGISTFTTMSPPHIEFNGQKEFNMSYVDIGDQYYTDREYTITGLPEALKNCLWMKTSNREKYLTDDNYVQFQLKRDATIYIAYDNRASAVPYWLSSGFEQTEYTIQNSDSESNFNVWKGQFSTGDVTLGANMATGAEGVQTNYTVLIVIPLQMLDPRDNKTGIGNNVIFSWEAIGNFENYDLQISDNQDISNPIYDITDIEYTSHKIRNLDYNKDYYWRIKAHNRDDEDAWYQTQKFHTMDDPHIRVWGSRGGYVLSWLEENEQYYVDRNHVILSIPDPLKNLLWIKTNNDDANLDTEINFDYGRPLAIKLENKATIYVGFDSRATSLPNWVTDYYKNTGLTISVSDKAKELNIWARKVYKGETVLGSNMAKGAENIKSQYIVLLDLYPLLAKFDSDVTKGVLPLTVNFSDSSQGKIESWAWDFGDGSTSLEQNPSHTYKNAGSYTVSLTVSGPDTFDTIIKENFITVYKTTPVANFDSDKTSGVLPLTVNFSDSSNGLIESWAWDFGDGVTSTEQNPSHTYENVGSYTVSLTVSNLDSSDTIIKENYITVKKPSPIANFGADVTNGLLPLSVSFTDSSLGDIVFWYWSFGDGLTSTSQNPTHVYSSADSFTVSLTVCDPRGSDTMVKTKYIIVDHPTSIDDMAGIPDKFDLLPNYPNPFNPQTTIRFAIPKKSFVKINVYDVNGKWVSNLISGIKNPGNYAITWNASSFSSGMYFIKMDTDAYSSVQKCILVK